MRKMTKTAVTLAAMSAMTVASASLAFAAVKEEPNISSIDNTQAPVDTSASGEWGGDAVKGYTFTKSDGVKLKDQWAEIDGVWYYFEGEKIVRNNFKVLDDKGYFFDENGRLATGWQKISSKMDAYGNIEIPDQLYNPNVNTYTTIDETKEYDYQDFVWCYFDEHGIAKKNEWYQDWTGLWYYFDGNAMVKNVYDYEVLPDNYDAADSKAERLYGFDGNGAMLVGWNSKTLDKNWNTPTADDAGKVWYYYNPNGRMQTTGWKQIDGKWYIFADRNADPTKTGNNVSLGGESGKWHVGGHPMLANSYVASYPNASASKPEYFYVNNKGELTTGVQNVKKAWKVIFYPEGSKDVQVKWETVKVRDKDIYVNFVDKGYAAKEGIAGNSYYALDTKDTDTDPYYKIEIRKAVFGSADDVKNISDGRYDARGIFDSKANGFKVTSAEWNFTDANNIISDGNGIYVLDVTGNSTYAVSGKAIEYLINEDAETEKTYQYKLKEEDLTYYLRTEDDVDAVSGLYRDYVTAVSEYVDAQNAWAEVVSNAQAAVSYVEAISSFKFLQDDSITIAGLSDSDVDSYINAVSPTYAVSPWSMNQYKDALKAIARAQKAIAKGTEKDDPAAVTAGQFVNALEDKLQKAVWKELDKAVAVTSANALADLEDAEEAMNQAKAELDSAVEAGKLSEYDNVNVGDIVDAVENAGSGYSFKVVGERVSNALIGRTSDGIYLADNKGELVKNKAVLIRSDAKIEKDGQIYNNAYLVFTADGTAAKGYESSKKSITVGGITYWATAHTVEMGDAKATVFVSNKMAYTGTDGAAQY